MSQKFKKKTRINRQKNWNSIRWFIDWLSHEYIEKKNGFWKQQKMVTVNISLKVKIFFLFFSLENFSSNISLRIFHSLRFINKICKTEEKIKFVSMYKHHIYKFTQPMCMCFLYNFSTTYICTFVHHHHYHYHQLHL